MNKPFIERCVDNETLDIDDFIDAWHASDSEDEIYVYLGMTKEEYFLWLEKPESLENIIHVRKKSME